MKMLEIEKTKTFFIISVLKVEYKRSLSLKSKLWSANFFQKRTDEFDLFAFLLFTANKSNQIRLFFWNKLADHKLLSRLSDL